MELDPYSHEDLQFVKEFVFSIGATAFPVDIGLGLSGNMLLKRYHLSFCTQELILT